MIQFTSKHSISEFKATNKADTLDIVNNPKTNKLIFTCGTASGKVSTKGYKEKPIISLCTDDETKEVFYLLHNESAVNVVDSL